MIVRITFAMLQVVASLAIVILMTRGVFYAPIVINYAPRAINYIPREHL
jgi:hypothetical protein